MQVVPYWHASLRFAAQSDFTTMGNLVDLKPLTPTQTAVTLLQMPTEGFRRQPEPEKNAEKCLYGRQ